MPLLVLAVGNVPTRTFLETKEGITTLRGRFFPCSWEGMNFTLRPVFHPSYLLRNESKKKGSPKELTWRDINALREKMDALSGENIKGGRSS